MTFLSQTFSHKNRKPCQKWLDNHSKKKEEKKDHFQGKLTSINFLEAGWLCMWTSFRVRQFPSDQPLLRAITVLQAWNCHFIVFTAGFLVWHIGDVQQTPVTPTHGAQVTTFQIPVFLTLMQKRGPADTRLTCSRTQSCRAQNQNPFCTYVCSGYSWHVNTGSLLSL